jgi:hypothetical protein
LAVALLRELQRARSAPPHGLSLAQLAASQRTDTLHVEPLVEQLIRLGWVARVDEEPTKRHVLLCDTTATCAEPLIDQLLLAPDVRTQAFRQRAGLGRVSVAELIGS